ncbi:MAG: class I SAM-dependent methyltransferase, partial [Ignavibacteria bacterium]
MNKIDFGRHSNDYAECRPGFPSSFYERLNTVININGTRVLDLATGPGIIALELAARGSSVTGIDISEGQIAAAKSEAKKRNLDDKT